MGYDIPEPYVWDESFKVFYDKLDEEHKGLFKGLFDVAGDKASAGKLAHLVGAVDAHFKNEESMMQAKSYADFPTHKQAHEAFLSKIKGLKAPVDDATVHFAKDWLVTHIKGTDFKYKGKL
uniref:Hemerythrin n=4 Tax=Polychaeta TaxID=6341 RepID=A0A1S6QCS4_PECGU|nr:hemerythrin [Ancistrosyllis groenlandica]AQV13691.1 hemerythrin [Naineris laevigata]AQV13701.1 hemerythrin [Alitta succinea]AQV13732.1 hemerythrin [Pectinaria gouldii]